MRVAGALLRKDLLLELRTREAVPAMALFSITCFVIFHFGLQRDVLAGELAAGVLLVTLLLASLLGMSRLFAAEREEGGFDGFLLAPVDRNALLAGKAAALLAFLLVLELIAVPAFAFLLLADPPPVLPLVAVLLLLDLGLAVVGTLVSAIAVQTRARELLVPMLALPLLIPALIASARALEPVLAERAGSLPLDWLAVLGLYDVVFALIAYGVFDFLLED